MIFPQDGGKNKKYGSNLWKFVREIALYLKLKILPTISMTFWFLEYISVTATLLLDYLNNYVLEL